MSKHTHQIVYEVIAQSQLSDEERVLISKAFDATRLAYAPYSNFKVGAALLLENGESIVASNKENASFPAGICAERNALNQASDCFPGVPVKMLAISVDSNKSGSLLSPCGICRQVMCETESKQFESMVVLIVQKDGSVFRFRDAKSLLPFHFSL